MIFFILIAIGIIVILLFFFNFWIVFGFVIIGAIIFAIVNFILKKIFGGF